jgi:Fur family transcriptional regulator, ferric uptake regulator
MRGRGRQKGRGYLEGRGNQENNEPGFRMTTSREVVMNVLKKMDGYLTADEIYSLARRVVPSLGLATVYRTLELLTNSYMVKRKEFGDGCSRYVYAEGNKKEHVCHLICESCGRVSDYIDLKDEERGLMDKLISRLENKLGFKGITDEIRVSGICGKCR